MNSFVKQSVFAGNTSEAAGHAWAGSPAFSFPAKAIDQFAGLNAPSAERLCSGVRVRPLHAMASSGACTIEITRPFSSGRLSFAGLKTPPWVMMTDLDGTMFDPGLSGPTPNASAAFGLLENCLASAGAELVYITGRHLELVEEAIAKYGLPYPAMLAVDAGSAIYLRGDGFWQKSEEWASHLRKTWKPEYTPALHKVIMQLDECRLQPESRQGEFKRSYWAAHRYNDVDVQRTLDVQVKAIADDAIQALVSKGPEGLLIDLLPGNGAKDDAGEFIAAMLGLSMERVFFSGDSGNDRRMLLKPGVMAAYVGDPAKPFAEELRTTYASSNVYLASRRNIFGVIESLEHYGLMPADEGCGTGRCA